MLQSPQYLFYELAPGKVRNCEMAYLEKYLPCSQFLFHFSQREFSKKVVTKREAKWCFKCIVGQPTPTAVAT